ncbi:MAG: beta-ketoacyl-ACP synthase II [Polyangiaceae bacterium]
MSPLDVARQDPLGVAARREVATRRVVVTGAGCISPLGTDLQTTFENLLAGRSGIRAITRFDASEYACRIAGEVCGFDFSRYNKVPRDAQRIDVFAQFSIACADMAIESAGLAIGDLPRERVGVSIGTGVGGLQVIERQQQKLLERGPRSVSALLIPMFLGNIASGHVAIRHSLRGPNLHVSTACATGTQAIGEAAWTIARGDADVMLAGGAESAITPLLISGFSAARTLSVRNDDPARASRPFERHRDGFVMGEGAAVLVLEEEQHARQRGALIWAEIAGYGSSSDAHHITAPEQNGTGARQAMQSALDRANLAPESIGYVNAHGTATQLGDVAESRALHAVFGEHASSKRLWISSTKSMIGHLLGAAGAVEAAVSLMSLRTGCVHPTLNLDEPDPSCDLDFVPREARERKLFAVMSNSFGFGGTNATLIFKQYRH